MAFSGIKNLFGMKNDNEKREKAFESSEISEEFKYLRIMEIQHLGIPENITKSLSFDRKQGLLALGSMEGSLKM
jgi:hypothetical protein